MGPPEIEHSLSELYAAPLGAFTEVRERLADEHRKAGQKAEAQAVKTARKPVLTAWAINAAVRQSPAALASLQAAGETLRRAQLENAPAAALQAAISERRRCVDGLVVLALAVLERSGSKASPALHERVKRNAEAIAAYGESQPEPAPGRWVKDLEPPGFEVLSGMTLVARMPATEGAPALPLVPAGPGRAAEQVHREAVMQAKARLREAELREQNVREEAEVTEQRAKELALAAQQAQERAVSKRELAEDASVEVEKLRRELAALEG